MKRRLMEKVVDVQLFNKAKRKIWSTLKITPSKPANIAIELTNRCNLNCPFCLVGMQEEQASVAHDDLGRPFGKMDLSTAEKIVVDAKAFGCKNVLLAFQGEPLLHPEFVRFVKLVKTHKMQATTFTNGMLLNPEYSRAIICAGLDAIRFSVDGATHGVYVQNRVGGDFETVFQNMRDFVQIAREEKSSIEMLWQFIALRNNEDEIEQARTLAEQIGIQFLVKTYAESIPDLAPRNEKYVRRLQIKPCTDIYRSIFVYWNGDVVPCCYDLVGKEIMGNVLGQSLSEIWNGSAYTDFRRKLKNVLQSPRDEPGLCRTCLKWRLPDELQS